MSFLLLSNASNAANSFALVLYVVVIREDSSNHADSMSETRCISTTVDHDDDETAPCGQRPEPL